MGSAPVIGLSISGNGIGLFGTAYAPIPPTPFWIALSVVDNTATLYTFKNGVSQTQPVSQVVQTERVSLLLGVSASGEVNGIDFQARLGQVGDLPESLCAFPD